MKKPFLLTFPPLLSVLLLPMAYAEVKVIEADGAYVMSDNDSKIDARRIAMQEVKRKALELAGTYVESLTEVKNYELTKDEVRTYASGIMETEVVTEQMRGTADHPEIYIRARCKIDTDVLMKLIEHYRDNEDLKEQLEASVKEGEALRKERDDLVRQLAAEKDKGKAAETRKKLDTALAKEETHDDTTRVWTNLAYKLGEGDKNGHEIQQAELDNSAAVLERAIMVNPRNQRAHILLAVIYQKKGDYARAENELRAVIQRSPSNPLPHMRLGILLRQTGRYEEALKEFHFVERLRPHNLMMLYYTGMTFRDMKRCGRSVQYLHKFLKDERSNRFPKYQDRALRSIEVCREGGAHQRRVSQD